MTSEEVDALVATVPDLFQAACESIFAYPVSQTRYYICRGYVSKPFDTLGNRTPAAFVLSAVNLDAAIIVAKGILDILDHIYIQGLAGRIAREDVGRVIALLQHRALLLEYEEARPILGEIGVPMHDRFTPDEIVVVPYGASVGFGQGTTAVCARVPLR